jgi:hypothetical protein
VIEHADNEATTQIAAVFGGVPHRPVGVHGRSRLTSSACQRDVTDRRSTVRSDEDVSELMLNVSEISEAYRPTTVWNASVVCHLI